jgi:hypothetical protein
MEGVGMNIFQIGCLISILLWAISLPLNLFLRNFNAVGGDIGAVLGWIMVLYLSTLLEEKKEVSL